LHECLSDPFDIYLDYKSMDYSSFPFPAQQNYFSCVMLSTFFPRIFNNNQSNHSHNLSGNLSLVSPSLSSNNYVSQQPSHQGHKGHHRNDSEIQMISVSKTTLNLGSSKRRCENMPNHNWSKLWFTKNWVCQMTFFTTFTIRQIAFLPKSQFVFIT